ncbi:HEAT repeat domain-containing protein [Fredinandcohnia humi]
MVYFVYLILLYSLLLLFLLLFIFIFLMVRKTYNHYFSIRNKQFKEMVSNELITFITGKETMPSRLFHQQGKWKREVILDILYDLASTLKSEEERMRINEICKEIGVDSELEQKIQHSEEWWIVAESIRKVGRLRLLELLPLVESNLTHSHYEVWTSAERVLLELRQSSTVIQYIVTNQTSLCEEKLTRLIAILLTKSVKCDHHYILAHFQNAVPLVKKMFIQLIAKQQTYQALPLLESLLDSEDSENRIVALKAIGELRITLNENKILAFFESQVWEERMVASRVVQNCSIRQAIPQLVQLLADSQWWVRLRAAEALFSFGKDGIKELNWCIEHHQDPFTRDIAKKVLEDKELEVYRG